MIRSVPALALLMLAAPALAQSTPEAARADGKAFGVAKAANAQAAATTKPNATRVPGYGGTPAQSGYFADPDRMVREAASQTSTNSGYRTMRDSMQRRAKFNAVDLDAAIARSRTISADPMTYASGMGGKGSAGSCVPLPPSTGTAARYFATCNTGYTASQENRSCTVRLTTALRDKSTYLYFCSTGGDCSAFIGSECRKTGTHPGLCLQRDKTFAGGGCTEPGDPVDEFTCTAPIAGYTPVSVMQSQTVDTVRDEGACNLLAAEADCTAGSETCTDSDPVTRIIGGVAVTQPCWAWERTYTCAAYEAKQDCSALEANPGCRFVRSDCLTDEPCRTWERVYDCPVPDQTPDADQFICDGDVYCIDGSCETIDRQPNTEFKDAAVALNALAQARREFDPANLSLFKGERASCASKVFGILNCCKGKGFPLIPGIQLLVALGCGREEMLLHQRDAQGLCSYVGTYCASSFLGVCFTKRKVYCCFESKLSRVLQEQGRVQLNKPWAPPKQETCAGFTVQEFAKLDLSKMDFSEVYAEFTDAARLPDELQAAGDLQQKIEAYYANASH
ncbi:conjugal transfer protein TraN [Novosphingobium sp. PASSN1]|uniref:conjugal transfer protein TraN n=1 Tax=Novosphingobium sp. PASSN1 TaxID=2015561 RepID=UPI000BCB40B6|nr:conjugal transfer protein TraN [Novosphingobium sp. PASSN1]OYU37293.1 MAG: conjugal transfer protein TraN [Novosphingobium sp. PASSN1]